MKCIYWPLILISSLVPVLTACGQERDKIQVALLLDVSGSMDQLVMKTKSQFWRISEHLSSATKNNQTPVVEVAVIIYGRSSAPYRSILNNFCSDPDSVAMNLYSIEIEGSVEYCWSTINLALDSLNWSEKKDDLKLIIIAGNEQFSEEQVNSKQVIKKAKKNNVVINTIYCSNTTKTSDSEEWRRAAIDSHGHYAIISLGDSVNLRENSMERKLIEFNDKLNATYVPFGSSGRKSYSRMVMQDNMTLLAGMAFFRERVIYKTTDSFMNPSWDMVDAVHADSTLLKNEDFLRNTSSPLSHKGNIRQFLADASDSRDTYREAIRMRYEMIRKYLGDSSGEKDFDVAVKAILDKEGRRRHFQFRAGSR